MGVFNLTCDVSFIDYEYVLHCIIVCASQQRRLANHDENPCSRHATFCPRAFELANHFAEWAGLECDYSQLPTRNQRRVFISVYLEAYSEIVGGNTYPPGDALGCPHAVTGAAVDKLMREVDSFRGFPGLYW
jgi:hypothetical protein